MSRAALAIVAVLLAIVVLVALLQGGTDYIGSDTLSAQAGIANPAATMQADSIGAWLLKAAGIGVILLALIAAVFAGIRLLRKPSGNWQGGPNARWKRKESQVLQPLEKQPSLVELMMLSMLRNQVGGGAPLPLSAPRNDDDNDPLEF